MNIDVDMQKIRRAVRRALEFMPGGLDIRDLARNDPDHDWEFRPVERLQSKHEQLGLYIKEGPLVTVFWDADLPIEEVQITIAHELGHHFLHSLSGRVHPDSPCEYELMEAEAEVFSRELLAVNWQ